MQEIENGIYITDEYPGITLGALVDPQGTIMVDAPPHPDDGRAWTGTIRGMGGGANRLLAVLDSHPDRAIGLRAMDTPIIAHDLTARILEDRPAVFKGQNTETGAEWELSDGLSGIRWGKPSLTFTKQAIIEWGEQTCYLEHHPGPAPGASWLLVPELAVVFVGDTLTVGQPPFMADADIDPWVDALDLLLVKPYKDYLIVSSRGGLVEQDMIREMRRFLKEAQRRLGRYDERGAEPEETAGTVDNLLTRFDFPAERKDFYTRRLAHGLRQYYVKHFRPEPEQEPE
ncbi:MAG TPA: MBL fold metallo-hydrolase [Anaerolineales bacterium]|nr:MBL fold metallo-hydrolase [Anaerolineales bacterium]